MASIPNAAWLAEALAPDRLQITVPCLSGTVTVAPSAWLPVIDEGGTLSTMASCPQCDGLMESLSFEKPREYLELARRLLNAVSDSKLAITESTCPLQDLFNPDWPGEIVEHNFECRACGRTYQLFADTYHGHACWGLTGPPTKKEPEKKEPPLTPSENEWRSALTS